MIRTLQTIQDYQSAADAHPKWPENAIEDYQGLKADVDEILSAINRGQLSPQSGTGTPEGTVFANYSLLYVDTTIPQKIYFNPTFNAKTGWVVIP